MRLRDACSHHYRLDPSDRNIKAADVADFAKVAMIVEVGDFQKIKGPAPFQPCASVESIPNSRQATAATSPVNSGTGTPPASRAEEFYPQDVVCLHGACLIPSHLISSHFA
jgi:hypothetical protein